MPDSFEKAMNSQINSLCNKLNAGFLPACTRKEIKEEIQKLVEQRDRVREAFRDESESINRYD